MMNSLSRINALCGSQLVKTSIRSMSKEIFPPSNEPEIPAYQEKVGESTELKKASGGSLGWNVDLEQQSPVYENVEEEPVLTSLVRQQYLKRLRQCLHENARCYDKSMDVGDAKSQVDRMAASLEKKALRSCMVAKLYIKSMLTIISDVKNKPEPAINVQIERSPTSLQRRSQISDVKNKPEPAINVQIERSPTSLQRRSQTPPNKSLISPSKSQISASKSQSTPNKKAQSCQSSISSNLLSQTVPFERTVQMKIPTMDEIRAYEGRQSEEGARGAPFLSQQDLNDVSSILDSLPLDLESQQSSFPTEPETPHLSLDQRLEQMRNMLPLPSTEDQSLEISSTNTAHDSLQNGQDPLSQDHLQSQDYRQSSKRKHGDSHKRRNDAIVAQYRAKKMLKVARVSEVAKKRISEVVLEDEQSLFHQRVATVFKLEQELQVLPLDRRTALERLYTKLFGPGHNYYLELSDEKQSDITRKRIASLVVSELEAYYTGEPKRIANKNLFKYLAKYLTELIYTINVCPDSAEVHEKVDEFFSDGRIVTCESDIFLDD